MKLFNRSLTYEPGVLPYIGYLGMSGANKWFLSPFGLKLGIDLEQGSGVGYVFLISRRIFLLFFVS